MIQKNKIVQFGISQKGDGQMRIREGNFALENRKRYFSKYGIDFHKVVSADLEHGNTVFIVDEKHFGKTIPESDALVTGRTGIYLAVTVSDCVPIFFYDEKRVIGIAHAGWRGVVSNIANKVINSMCKKFSSDPRNIKVYVGPHIKKCHFEIRQGIISQFKDYPYSIEKRNGRVFINLEKIIRSQLRDAGILASNIEISPDCTYCNDKYFSFRRDKPTEVMSQIAYIALI